MAYRYRLQYKTLEYDGAPEGYLPESVVDCASGGLMTRNGGSVAYAEPLSAQQVKDYMLAYVAEDDGVIPAAAPLSMRGVTVGDVFSIGKHGLAQVVDILEQRSLVTGEVVDYVCIAKGLGLAHNRFVTPFASVARNRIQAAVPDPLQARPVAQPCQVKAVAGTPRLALDPLLRRLRK